MGTAEVTKSIPITMSGMSQLLIGVGRKTQTRRLIKEAIRNPDSWKAEWINEVNGYLTDGEIELLPPYPSGSILWTRERYWRNDHLDFILYARSPDRGRDSHGNRVYLTTENGQVLPRSEANFLLCFDDLWRECGAWYQWKWGARYLLRSRGCYPERLCDITASDAMAEGVGGEFSVLRDGKISTFENNYFEWWDEMHGGKPGCAATDNPWVWVTKFELLDEGKGGSRLVILENVYDEIETMDTTQ